MNNCYLENCRSSRSKYWRKLNSYSPKKLSRCANLQTKLIEEMIFFTRRRFIIPQVLRKPISYSLHVQHARRSVKSSSTDEICWLEMERQNFVLAKASIKCQQAHTNLKEIAVRKVKNSILRKRWKAGKYGPV